MDIVLHAQYDHELPLSSLDDEEFLSHLDALDWRHTPRSCENPLATWISIDGRKKRTGTKKILRSSASHALPVEVTLEIFCLLHPLDLYNIARTSKSMRSLVLSRIAAPVWKTAFARHPSLPRCPPDVSEPQCTTLLFGPLNCDECGEPETLLDFMLRRHLCTHCMKRLLIYQVPSGYSEDPYEINDIVRELLPYTRRTNGNAYWRSAGAEHRRYMESDVRSMAERVKSFVTFIHQGKPGAKESFESFQRTTKEYVDARKAHARHCLEWAISTYDIVHEALQEEREEIESRVTSRVIALGYSHSDIVRAGLDDRMSRPLGVRRLTRCVWRDILPIIEAKLAPIKEERLLEERRHLSTKKRRFSGNPFTSRD